MKAEEPTGTGLTRKKSKYCIFVNLMCFTGMSLLICAVPAGIMVGLQSYSLFHLVTEAIGLGMIMILLTAATGSLLLWIGIYLLKKLQRVGANQI